ncbi:MAG: 1-(5-phosphoribosyl)-5-[(5-phosphoribosylamino)methylideneamino]imidazole-4-carboxamide isomerase [Gammaproteobacteria bacterium TMED119]|nr:MAG: 1-(5-phosphoribosyl)-5-[(5-phosphoribosylamino)methylideneamino]imidazole-4-carboxamide isomerase [Gammaproteobacteria bacterium TMED119]|tara:strand:+ start:998 stop:1735 length:738 start_codon:yes stop_codon:yes gene_type:complete
MIIIPAIDIKDGRCVRLRQGRMDDETIFADDPVEMADKWVQAGAQRLHLVDLDGATEGAPRNFSIVEKIAAKYPDLPIQVGGGIRDEDTVDQYLECGVQYVIIGTRAVTAPHFVNDLCLEFPGHIIIGLDAKNGKVAIDGWSKLSHHDVIDLAQHFEADGVAAIVFTDVSRDGMMQGVNVESTVELAASIHIPVIASGGVTDLNDIKRLCATDEEGIVGVVVGRALYEGTIDLAEAQALASQHQP